GGGGGTAAHVLGARVKGDSAASTTVGIRFGEVVGLVTGAGAAYGIVAAASPILTRPYSPADFGHFQVYITVFSFLLIAAAGRLEVAVLLPKEVRGGVEVAVLGLAAVGVTWTVTLIAWTVVWAAGVLHGPLEVIARYGWILPAATAGGGATAVMMQWVLREGDLRAVSIARVTQSTTIATTQVATALTPATAGAGLMLGDAAGRLPRA